MWPFIHLLWLPPSVGKREREVIDYLTPVNIRSSRNNKADRIGTSEPFARTRFLGKVERGSTWVNTRLPSSFRWLKTCKKTSNARIQKAKVPTGLWTKLELAPFAARVFECTFFLWNRTSFIKNVQQNSSELKYFMKCYVLFQLVLPGLM